MDFDDLTAALKKVRSSLDSQLGDVSQLWEKNGHLEKELSALEARLKEVERLKKELEQVRRAREIQEAQLAKVKQEVLTVGEEIERITNALEEKFGRSLVVTQHHDRLVLTLLGQVLFASGEAELTPLGLNIMKQVGQVLVTFPEKYIQVEGHTDNNPIFGQLQRQYPTNWELSTARATTVLRYLIEQTGMDPKQFSASGYADTRPVQTNETEEGRAQKPSSRNCAFSGTGYRRQGKSGDTRPVTSGVRSERDEILGISLVCHLTILLGKRPIPSPVFNLIFS